MYLRNVLAILFTSSGTLSNIDVYIMWLSYLLTMSAPEQCAHNYITTFALYFIIMTQKRISDSNFFPCLKPTIIKQCQWRLVFLNYSCRRWPHFLTNVTTYGPLNQNIQFTDIYILIISTISLLHYSSSRSFDPMINISETRHMH
jgi:hypothetical protein